MQLILASSSPYRRALLARLGLAFDCVAPEIDESRREGETPQQLVLRLSLEKAGAVARHHPEALVIGSDQVACLDGEVLGKPGDEATAIRQLQQQSGRTVQFLTGVCLFDGTDNSHDTQLETVTVQFRDLSDTEIQRYLQQEQPWDCAGSFKSEARGVGLVQAIRCTDSTALMGLPLIRTAAMLRAKNYNIP
ncbi:MAG: Maf family protein [Gammaproteobacteria bacterium]